MEIDKKIILKLLKILDELKKTTEGLKDVNIEEVNAKVVDENEISVKSPIVGTAYLAPEPGAKTFVSVGKKIKKGDTVMIIEAMKTMNHVPSTSDGVIKKVCVEDGQPVEFGQKLVILE
tara:strand:+ start:149 stop:505 length:357 start_codon:yes stop_codon:yes gene_type:complete